MPSLSAGQATVGSAYWLPYVGVPVTCAGPSEVAFEDPNGVRGRLISFVDPSGNRYLCHPTEPCWFPEIGQSLANDPVSAPRKPAK